MALTTRQQELCESSPADGMADDLFGFDGREPRAGKCRSRLETGEVTADAGQHQRHRRHAHHEQGKDHDDNDGENSEHDRSR